MSEETDSHPTKRSRKSNTKDVLLASRQEDEEVNEPLPQVATNGVKLPLLSDKVEEEVDEPLEGFTRISDGPVSVIDGMQIEDQNALIETNVEQIQTCSTECSEAIAAITSDCWDISAWVNFLEEVENGRGGSITVFDAYKKILFQFPRSAGLWRRLAEYLIRAHQVQTAEDMLLASVTKCRNVELWRTYINLKKRQYNEVSSNKSLNIEHLLAERKKFEIVLENAIDNIGLSIDSYPIWREYINFVRDWQETGAVETNRKIITLRTLYHRALITPLDIIGDELWSEYEHFEKSRAEKDTEITTMLNEYNKKYLHAKSIARDRKKYMSNIMFDRLATPPAQSLMEMQQLDYWNQWLKFEMSNPDNLDASGLHRQIRYIYDLCLNCFRYNPEIWLSFTRYYEKQHHLQQQQQNNNKNIIIDSMEIKRIYHEAIDINSNVVLLRISLAEYEEIINDYISAQDTYSKCFQSMPSGFTFSLLQRFIRRNGGCVAARKLFTETLPIRNQNPTLGLEIIIAHAKMELEINCDPQIALKILNLATTAYPNIAFKNVPFVRMMSRVLVTLGDLKQLRWIFQTALESGDHQILNSNILNPDLNATTTSSTTNTNKSNTNNNDSNNDKTSSSSSATAATTTENNPTTMIQPFSLREELELYEDYLNAEITLGMSDINRLNDLREKRDRMKLAVQEYERARLGTMIPGSNILTRDEAKQLSLNNILGLFDTAKELTERYEYVCNYSNYLPRYDQELKERVYNIINKDKQQQQQLQHQQQMRQVTSSSSNNKQLTSRDNAQHMSTEFHLSLAGLPPMIRDLLMKLPPPVGGHIHSNEIEIFIRHMKNVILPPRPSVEEILNSNTSSADWLSNGNNNDNDNDEDGENGIDMLRDNTRDNGYFGGQQTAEDDVFRQRQRAKANAAF